jgi:hypothetical protein
MSGVSTKPQAPSSREAPSSNVQSRSGAAAPPDPSSLSDAVPLIDRVYVVRDSGGKYLESIKRTDWQTVRWVYAWTTDFAKARRFAATELFVRGPEALSAKEQDKSFAMNLTVGYGASVGFVRIK